MKFSDFSSWMSRVCHFLAPTQKQVFPEWTKLLLLLLWWLIQLFLSFLLMQQVPIFSCVFIFCVFFPKCCARVVKLVKLFSSFACVLPFLRPCCALSSQGHRRKQFMTTKKAQINIHLTSLNREICLSYIFFTQKRFYLLDCFWQESSVKNVLWALVQQLPPNVH